MKTSEVDLLVLSTATLKCTKKWMHVPVKSCVAAPATRCELTVTHGALTLTKLKLLAIPMLLIDSITLIKT